PPPLPYTTLFRSWQFTGDSRPHANHCAGADPAALMHHHTEPEVGQRPHLAVSTDHHVRSQCDTVADLAVVRDMRAAQEIPVAADAGRPFGPLMDAAVFADAVAVADAHAEPVPLGITRRGVLPRRRVGRT